MRYFSFSGWLTSLSIGIPRSIHVATNGIIAYFLMVELHSIAHKYHIFFIHSFVDGHLGCFHVLVRRRRWHPTPVFLPGKSHGRRSLVGCSPWGHEESDTTERLHFHFSLSCIGEGNGNPLQCSCLENPRDGGAWWAAICGIAQSQTGLKQLSLGYTMLHWGACILLDHVQYMAGVGLQDHMAALFLVL